MPFDGDEEEKLRPGGYGRPETRQGVCVANCRPGDFTEAMLPPGYPLKQYLTDVVACSKGDSIACGRAKVVQDMMRAHRGSQGQNSPQQQSSTLPGSGGQQSQTPWDPSAPGPQQTPSNPNNAGGQNNGPLAQFPPPGETSFGKIAIGLGLAYLVYKYLA